MAESNLWEVWAAAGSTVAASQPSGALVSAASMHVAAAGVTPVCVLCRRDVCKQRGVRTAAMLRTARIPASTVGAQWPRCDMGHPVVVYDKRRPCMILRHKPASGLGALAGRTSPALTVLLQCCVCPCVC